MARMLWLNWSGGGNLPPSLGIARVLFERGHEVAFAGRPEMVDRVTDAGFRAIELRSAYAQLNYSPLQLIACVAGLILTYMIPPLMALFASGWPQIFGIAACALMAMSFQPVLRFYRLSPLWGVALPAITFLFMLYTLDSAYQYFAGKGGTWKGRVQAKAHGDSR